MPLDLCHRNAIESHLDRLRVGFGWNCLAEFPFPNLYQFRAAHAYRFLPGPWPCVGGVTYDGMRHLLPLFDPRDAPPERLAELLRKKRNLMRQLLATHRVRTHRLERARVPDALRVLECWMGDKHKAAGEADELPCIEALGLLDDFRFDGEIHYVDDAPVGFVIAEPLAPGVAVMRFAKGTDSHKGIYQYLFHHYCAARADRLEWLNFEQDLGLANFRRTKRSYQPEALLGKYRVRTAE